MCGLENRRGGELIVDAFDTDPLMGDEALRFSLLLGNIVTTCDYIIQTEQIATRQVR